MKRAFETMKHDTKVNRQEYYKNAIVEISLSENERQI